MNEEEQQPSSAVCGESDVLATTHEVMNQPPALENYNAFAGDNALRDALTREGGDWDVASISRYGEHTGSTQVIEYGFLANEHKPQFHPHDRYGHRVDLVTFHPSYHALMDMAMTEGLHSSPWRNPRSGAHVARAAKSYLQAQVEAGHGCPLTMTFASVPTLKLSESVAERWLPKVLANEYDPRNIPDAQKRAVTIGMGMTEKQGGSDVRANSSVARPLGVGGVAGGNGQPYELTGHKWFMSAPMCDGFLMLAQAPAGLSCFLVPRWRPDGSKNPLQVQRLKNKMGNVSNASSEVEMRGALGWLVGEEGRGVPAIIEMVSLTRFDCMVGSMAGQRQAVVQAVHHAAHRSAFGKTLIDQPLMQNVLADLHLEVEGAMALTMRMARALDGLDQEDEKLLMRLGTAVGKYWICKRAPNHAYEAMECLGGNGVTEDFIMARLYREAPINAIWEGSGNVQALDVLRALAKTPAVLEVWFAELSKGMGQIKALDVAVARLKEAFTDLSDIEYRARYLVEQLALTMQGSLLVQAGNNAVAEAFVASRLGDHGERNYGSLPRGLDLSALLHRANPLSA